MGRCTVEEEEKALFHIRTGVRFIIVNILQSVCVLAYACKSIYW